MQELRCDKNNIHLLAAQYNNPTFEEEEVSEEKENIQTLEVNEISSEKKEIEIIKMKDGEEDIILLKNFKGKKLPSLKFLRSRVGLRRINLLKKKKQKKIPLF